MHALNTMQDSSHLLPMHTVYEVSTSYLTSDSDITVVRRMNIVFCLHMPFCSFLHIFSADYFITVIV